MATTTRDAIVPFLLDQTNYEDWSIYMKNYLMAQHLWSMVEHGVAATGHLVSPLDKAKNAAALHAIHIASSPDIFTKIKSIGPAKDAWDELAKMYQEEKSEEDEGQSESEQQSEEDQGQSESEQQSEEDQGQSESEQQSEEDQGQSESEQQSEEDQGQSESEQQSEEDQEQSEKEDFEMMKTKRGAWVKLRQGIWKGEWVAVEQFLKKHPVNTVVDEIDGTTLHLAINARQEEIAEKLVEMMSTTDLEIKDSTEDTALHLAAMNGTINTAKCLVRKHPILLTMSNVNGDIPIISASNYTQGEMIRYLYSVTPHDLLLPENGSHGLLLMSRGISDKMFDFALILIQRNPELAVSFKDEAQSPIFVLSTQPSAFYSGCRLSFWQTRIYHLIKVKRPTTATQPSHDKIQVFSWSFGADSNLLKFLGIKEICDLKLSHFYALEVLCCICNYVAYLNQKQYDECELYDAIFEAAKHGIFEFFIELWRTIPITRQYRVKNNRNVLMVAIQYRQEKVFQLLYDMSEKWMLECVTILDKDANSILHVAGELAPDFQLSRISGAALQMQRELQWFKVERITPTSCKEAKNRDGLTARELFTKTHKELLKEGEKWMTNTANSFIIVGALIVTIMFAVAFTVPGGNDQNTGFPIFLSEKSFKVFLLSDAISFFAASTSILMFLGILTSRYAEDDFLVSLPRKLIIGLSALFISTTSMMVSFSVALLIMLRGQWWAIIPIILIATIPVTLFVWLQFPLLVRIFVSTYASGSIGKK